jgi:hypothetical protein
MNKTLFAGLTQLDPGESLQSDNASFQSENPVITDRLLEIGAVTHRHNAHPAQANPASGFAPGASAVASGGVIPADTAIYIGYTLRDFEQGETLISPLVTVTTEAALDQPADAPTAVIDYTGGGLVADTYYYALSTLDAEGGETPIGPATTVEREPGYASGRVQLSGLLAPIQAASGAAWRLWRAEGGGDLFSIASGATDTFTDDGTACADCTLAPVNEFANLTNGDNSLIVTIPSGDVAQTTASAISLYLTTDPSFESGALAGTYPIASAGKPLTFRSLNVEDHRPPDVPTCIPGASKIDPDTELLDWSWKRPVATAADLPADADEGDVRITLDSGLPHRFVGGAWDTWSLSGGGTINVGPLSDISTLRFVGSGGASATVTSSGVGGALVTIAVPSGGAGGGGVGPQGPAGPQGPPGPPGSGGSGGVAGSGTVEVYGSDKTVYDASLLNFGAADGLSLVVEVTPEGRADIVYGRGSTRGVVTVAASAAVASGATVALAAPLGKSFTLMNVKASCPVRLRAYVSAAKRAADAARPIGTAPTGEHGLIFERIEAADAPDTWATSVSENFSSNTTAAGFNQQGNAATSVNGYMETTAPGANHDLIGSWTAGGNVGDTDRVTCSITMDYTYKSDQRQALAIVYEWFNSYLALGHDGDGNLALWAGDSHVGAPPPVQSVAMTGGKPAQGTKIYFRGTRKGNIVLCEEFRADPALGGAPNTSFTYDLGAGAYFGAGVNGFKAGFIQAGTSGNGGVGPASRFDDFKIERGPTPGAVAPHLVTPGVCGFSYESPPTGDIAISLTNLAASQVPSVDFERLVTEF